jgi:hypothetical protein
MARRQPITKFEMEALMDLLEVFPVADLCNRASAGLLSEDDATAAEIEDYIRSLMLAARNCTDLAVRLMAIRDLARQRAEIAKKLKA